MEDTDRFSFNFALNTSSRLLWGSMAFARKVTDLDIAWHFFLCISNHWVLSCALFFFSSELLKGGGKKKKKNTMTNLDIFKSNLSNLSGKLVLSMKRGGGVIYLPGISERLRFWHQMHGHMTPSQHSGYSDILPRRVSLIELKKRVNKISLLKQPNIQACCLSWNKILIATL